MYSISQRGWVLNFGVIRVFYFDVAIPEAHVCGVSGDVKRIYRVNLYSFYAQIHKTFSVVYSLVVLLAFQSMSLRLSSVRQQLCSIVLVLPAVAKTRSS
jgi:hypothetical protein